MDTGPLLTYLALCYLDREGAPKAERDKVFHEGRPHSTNFAETEQDRLRLALDREVLTTPHVLAEVLKLRENSNLKKKGDFLPYCLNVLAQDRIVEIPCPATALSRESSFRRLIQRYGLTDAALIFVAAQRGALLLTDDAPLSRDYSAGAGYEIRLLDDYLRE